MLIAVALLKAYMAVGLLFATLLFVITFWNKNPEADDVIVFVVVVVAWPYVLPLFVSEVMRKRRERLARDNSKDNSTRS